jgi:hypothetical protein
MRVFNPTDHPARVYLHADPSETRTDLGYILISLHKVTPSTAYLLKDPLALRQEGRIFKRLDIKMTGGATRLNFGAAKQRMFPIGNLSMSLLDAVDRRSLPLMAWRTTKLFWRMGVIRQQNFTPWMSAERLGLLFKTRTVDGHVAGLAPIYPGDRLVKVITIKLIEHDLTDLGDFIKGEKA